MFLGACIPLVSILGVFTTIGVIVICVTVLTGPIYYNKTGPDGRLAKWNNANKVAAVILLILFIGGYGFIIFWAFLRN